MASRTEPGRNGTKNVDQKRGQPQQRGQSAQSGQGGQKAAQAGEAQRGSSAEAAPDELYGVVSVLYHALQGAQTYTQYSSDARSAGDEELVEFFDTCRDEENGRAERAKMLLAERLMDMEDEADDEDEAESEEDDEET
jgi:hypothetical protein